MSSLPPAAPAFVPLLFGYRLRSEDGTVGIFPNCADGASRTSIAIANAIMASLGVLPGTVGPLDPGSALEIGVQNWLAAELPKLAPDRAWSLYRDKVVSHFQQYAHLARLKALIDADATKTLKAEIGTDYLVAPDITVGLHLAVGDTLHASVSCKWTIRSDRVQNI